MEPVGEDFLAVCLSALLFDGVIRRDVRRQFGAGVLRAFPDSCEDSERSSRVQIAL